MKLSLVIPCYNEAKNISLLLKKLEMGVIRSDVEVLLVDNGSTDDTQNVLQALLPDYPFVRVIKVPINQGYGFGILNGLREGVGEYLAWTHADMQTDPRDPIKALEIVEGFGNSTNIFVKGLRKGRPVFDQIFTVGMSLFETIFFGRTLWDVNAQPNLFHRSFFESWKNPPHDFSLDLYALFSAQKQGLVVKRFDVVFPPRLHGASNWNTGFIGKWKFIKRTLEFSFELKRRQARLSLKGGVKHGK